ncbi:MAG: N-acetylmuramoyl-L-alanine amidase [Cyanobacteria bacterium J06641_5]
MYFLRNYSLWLATASILFITIALGLEHEASGRSEPEVRPLRSGIGETFTQLKLPCDWVVVIDPGHGGHEYVGRSSPNNAKGEELLEKDLTLEVGLATKRFLDRSDYRVFMTRTTDINLSLRDRTKFARDKQADVFVSIHFNGFDNETTQGTETIYHSDASQRSIELAKKIQTNVLGATGLRNRGVRTTENIDLDIVVLRPGQHKQKTAAALVEISFLTDPDEEERLKRTGYKRTLSRAIQYAIGEHLSQEQVALDCVP